jgi:hypothetical protein
MTRLPFTRHSLAASLLATVALGAGPALARCNHPYFPTRQGERYVYSRSGALLTQVLAKVEGDSFTFDVTTKSPDGRSSTTQLIGECSAGGISLNVGTLQIPTGDSIRTLNHSGADFGAAAQMKVGGSWSSDVTRLIVARSATVRTRTRTSTKVVATERIDVPAGQYQALKIEAETEVTTAVMSASDPTKTPPSGVRRSRTLFWLAKGVGIVKSETTDSSGKPQPAIELVSFSR